MVEDPIVTGAPHRLEAILLQAAATIASLVFAMLRIHHIRNARLEALIEKANARQVYCVHEPQEPRDSPAYIRMIFTAQKLLSASARRLRRQEPLLEPRALAKRILILRKAYIVSRGELTKNYRS